MRAEAHRPPRWTWASSRSGKRILLDEFHALTKARRVHRDGNQAMTWCVVNAAVKQNENENIRPVKRNPKQRIDGVVAAVTALARLMVLPDRPASPYADRGVRSGG